MVSSIEQIKEDVESNIEWQLFDEAPFRAVFKYSPSTDIAIPEHGAVPASVSFSYKDAKDFNKNKNKAYKSAVNMYLNYLTGTEATDFTTRRFAGLMFSRFYLKPVEGDTRSYIRIGRVEFYTDPSSLTSKRGFKYDRKSELNPVFALAIAGETPTLYAVTVRGAKK